MAGRLIGVVGPSGVGKDALICALAGARPDLHVVRRFITRRADAVGEIFESVSSETFRRRRDAGHFALHWQAHGFCYGIPASLGDQLRQGRTCLVNLSRSVLSEAESRFTGFVTLSLSAPPDILAARLSARGRETEEEIAKRLSRSGEGLPDGLGHVIRIANDGPLQDTVARALGALYPEKV